MKRLLPFALLLLTAVAVAASLTASWTAPTQNTDGTAITAPLTYNLYTGAKGAEVKTQANLTATQATIAGLTAGAQTCATVTAVANGVESAQSAEVCATPAFPTPNPPTNLLVR